MYKIGIKSKRSAFYLFNNKFLINRLIQLKNVPKIRLPDILFSSRKVICFPFFSIFV